jgi:AraC-like DNA-binding protein
MERKMSMVEGNTPGSPPVVRFVRPARAPGLELVHYPNLTRGWRGIPEGYRWFTLIDRLEGDVEVISRGVRGHCAADSVTVGEPGEPYIIRPHSPMRGEFRVIRVDSDMLAALLQELDARHPADPFPREPQQDPALTRAFRRLYQAIAHEETLAWQECLVAFLATLTTQERRGSPGSRGSLSPGVRQARDLLHGCFADPLTLDELAAAAGMTKFALLRAFTHALGITPGAYQTHLRMARARRLIAQGLPLTDVALEVGYSEQSALHRAFVRLVGVTPGVYARAGNIGQDNLPPRG